MQADVPHDARLYADDTVYWTSPDLLPGDQQENMRDYVKEHWEEFWVNPSDGDTRTRQALSYRDNLTLLLVHEDAGMIGYDASFSLDAQRLNEMYSTRLDPAVSPHLDRHDIALVYHFVIDEAYRGNGYGVGTAFLRQDVLEEGWAEDWLGKTPADHYHDIISSMDRDTPLTADFPSRANQFTAALADGRRHDAIISLPRLFETSADKDREIISRAYRISDGFGCRDANLPLNGDERLVYKTDPATDLTIPAAPGTI
ncbi:MAG: hypothetical protein SVW77_00850 [Candidatus Nanohaloarchaea archaeon]|nr:hypothetical protein [Candidatus Nanohaloarchaea archaeon]